VIEDRAFAYSSHLGKVLFPAGLQIIGKSAFAGVILTRVVFMGNAPSVGAGAFSGISINAQLLRAINISGYGANGALWNGFIVTELVP